MKRVGTVLYGCLILALGVVPGYGQVVQMANQGSPGFVVQPVNLQGGSVAMSGVDEPVDGRLMDVQPPGKKPTVVTVTDGDAFVPGNLMAGVCGECGSCGDCGCGGDCDDDNFNAWRHRTGFFGEFLYLRAYNVDMAQGIQLNGVLNPGVIAQGNDPIGRVGVASPQFEPGFRIGFSRNIDTCASISAAYTQFESHTSDSLAAPNVVGGSAASLVLFPDATTSASANTGLDATYDIDFKLVDVDYNRMLVGSSNGVINYTLGARYGMLNQDFAQFGSFAQPRGSIVTNSTINFDGVGMRTGFDGQRRICNSNLSFYGKSYLSILFGEFRSEYNEVNTTESTVLATSNSTNQRVVPILEYEVGLAWTSCNGRWRINSGYYTAFWFNAITTPEYIQAVQNSDFAHMGQSIAFTGLTSRIEYRF